MEEKKEEKNDINLINEVGAMSYKALIKARDMVKVGARLSDVAKHAEGFLKENGYGAAFPLNLSIGMQAAHYTPSVDDETVFGEHDLVKVDFGAEKNGILGDCALTVDLSHNNQKLIEAVNDALQNALSVIKSGVEVRSIGKEIERTILSKGFVPIRNLGGHSVKTHELHSDIFIPNYDNGDETKLEENMTVAIEPFATNGKGLVTESDICDIYSFDVEVNVRMREARQIQEEIKKSYSHEPFAVRWLSNVVGSRFGLYAGIAELSRNGGLTRHPTLIEVGKGLVSQAELEVIVEKDSCRILTKV